MCFLVQGRRNRCSLERESIDFSVLSKQAD